MAQQTVNDLDSSEDELEPEYMPAKKRPRVIAAATYDEELPAWRRDLIANLYADSGVLS